MDFCEICLKSKNLTAEAYCPDELLHLWLWFVRDFWPHPRSDGLTFLELEAWSRVRGVHLSSLDVTLLMQLDILYNNILHEKATKPKNVIDARNVQGVKAMLSGFNARAQALKKEGLL